ncbi:MAG: [Fe-Fe] hydrogenase large subunit C-terminal domain-containing protein [Erysipelotrichaceae bacterium]|nr:[Fe-Fe] hydrogenase large subunit C-terminal domain-containing protein [Erysipelotrichaceae bacterium]
MGVLQYRSTNCKNCYKCIRHCPVKAIQFRNEKAKNIDSECIYCGRCVQICPQGSKTIRNDYSMIETWLQEGKQVIASVAPSFVAAFDLVSFEPLQKALYALGFSHAEETAYGANIVKQKYEEILKQEHPKVLISSCCSSINLLIQKFYPDCLPYLANVVSPMEAHGQYLKQLYPDALVVFIGPCAAKKVEVEDSAYGYIDATITFAELYEVLQKKEIMLDKKETDSERYTRWFPKTGGVIQTMNPHPDYTYMSIDRIEDCMEALEEIQQGNLENVFLEMNSCEGGCLNGPGMPNNCLRRIGANQNLAKIAGNHIQRDFNADYSKVSQATFKNLDHRDPIPSERQLIEIYNRMGKYSEKDFLNCGACGYNSCKEKAIAIFQGKADSNMCLPFMKEKAENISRQVLKSSPNAVIALDLDFKIQSFNRSAYELLDINPNVQVIGEDIEHWLDVDQFVRVLSEGNIMDEISYLPKIHKYVEKRVVYDEDVQMILIIMKDATQQQMKAEQRKSLKNNTIEITEGIINKQMRIVQEIASLLGETTAETKIALKHLRDVVIEEDQE